MWVFTPFGFFSAVSHRDRPKYVMIRARVRKDLEQLVERLPGKKPKIVATPEADYPYRVTISKVSFGYILDEFVNDELTYPNFKSEAPARMPVYHRVWEALHALEAPRAMEPRGSIDSRRRSG